MTTPIPIDRPDYGGQASVAGALLVNNSGKALAAPDVIGPFPTTLSPYLGLYTYGDVSNSYVVFDFYSDEALTVHLVGITFSLRANKWVQQSIPVGGPWCKITVTPFGATSTYTLRVWFIPTPFFPLNLFSNENVLITQSSVAVAAGATLTVVSDRIYAGPAFWFCLLENGISFRAELRTIDNFGTTTMIDYTTHAQRLNVGPVYLPTEVAEITVTNFEGATPRNCWMALVAKPLSQ
jgi:hypothetical protein